MTFADLLNAIFSRALESGLIPPDVRGGPAIGRYGQDRVHVSPSASQESGKGSTIIGTFGPTFIDSFVPAGPLKSWENRLRERLGTIGSTESPLIWREKTTPAGRSISRLVPSTRRTNETEFTGARWPTVTTTEIVDEDFHARQTERRLRSAGAAKGGCGPTLGNVMNMAAMWQTVKASDGEKGCPNGWYSGVISIPLPSQMHRSTWATVTARDHRSGKASQMTHDHNARPLNEQMTPPSGLSTLNTNGSSATTEKSGVPNPEHPCWLMGLPDAYLCGAVWATRFSRGSRKKSSGPISKQMDSPLARVRLAQQTLAASRMTTAPPDEL